MDNRVATCPSSPNMGMISDRYAVSDRYRTVATERPIRRLAAALLIASGAGLVSGCGTTQVAVQWSDPEFKGRSLRGEKVFVVCEAPDVAIRNTCQDNVAARLREAGATAVIGSAPGLTVGQPPANDATLAAARAAGAKAILGSTITHDVTVVGSGSRVGFGFGGVSGGGGGYGRGAGVGLGVPVGGAQESSSYKASLVLTDVASARVMWSGTITTLASDDIGHQVNELARVGVEAAREAGYF